MKKKILSLLIVSVLVVMMFSLAGCGNKEQTTNNVTGQEANHNEQKEIKNDELNDVYAYTIKTDGKGDSFIVALKTDGSELSILNTESTVYNCIDYSYGKLYLQKGTEFYEIDLTKGNGNYSIESIYKITSDEDWQNKQMIVYDGVLYFNKGNKQIVGYNLTTKEENVIGVGYSVKFDIDKNDGIMYYCTSVSTVGTEVFGTYDLKSKEKKELIKEKIEKGRGTRMILGSATDNGVILYTTDGYENIGYEYNIETNEKTKIDSSLYGETDFYQNGKLYFVKSHEKQLYVEYSLELYENGQITKLCDFGEEHINNISLLNNGKIQIVVNGGQDISTAYTKTYLVDSNTYQKNVTYTTYSDLSYVVEGSDTHTDEVSAENTNTNTYAKEDLIGEWKVKGTNSTEYSSGYLYGSSLNMVNSLKFMEDGTYSLGVGFTYNETGNYEIQGDTIKLTNIKSEGDSPDAPSRADTEELLIKKENETTKIIFKEDYAVPGLTIDVIFEKYN